MISDVSKFIFLHVQVIFFCCFSKWFWRIFRAGNLPSTCWWLAIANEGEWFFNNTVLLHMHFFHVLLLTWWVFLCKLLSLKELIKCAIKQCSDASFLTGKCLCFGSDNIIKHFDSVMTFYACSVLQIYWESVNPSKLFYKIFDPLYLFLEHVYW